MKLLQTGETYRRRLATGLHRRRTRRAVRHLLSNARPELAVEQIRLVETFNDVDVATCVSGDGQRLIAKVSRSRRADRALRRHHVSMENLQGLDSLLGDLVPRPIHIGHRGERVFVVETALDGTSMDNLAGKSRLSAHHNALAVLQQLHEIDSKWVDADGELVRQWVAAPVSRLVRAAGDPGVEASAARLDAELQATLNNRELMVGRIHGDFAPCNILTTDTGVVTGLVDWENSRRDSLPEIDLAQFSLFSCPSGVYELGDLVNETLSSDRFASPCAELGTLAMAQSPNQLGIRTGVLLAWLTHVSDNLRKAEDVCDQAWFTANVRTVLETADATR